MISTTETPNLSALIVDDAPVIRLLLCRLLSSYSVECDEAKTGYEAKEQFERRLQSERPYDLLFLDVNIPQMDGCAVLAHIRSIESGFPDVAPVYTIVLTSDNSTETVQRMRSAGANTYCLKPLDRGLVGSLLERARRHKVERAGQQKLLRTTTA